jgi:adenosylcobinamide-phosphate synthase
MITLYALLTGYILDLLLGDPVWLPHPIRWMGLIISRGEALLRRLSCRTSKSQFISGILLTMAVTAVSFMLPYCLLKLAQDINLLLAFGLESFMCYQILATKSLKAESMSVYRALIGGDLPEARKKLSRIVSRDTQHLNELQVAKGTVETIAENTSDGVIAPMLFIMIGGAPLGFLYKAINTLDSMVGYQNDSYLFLGRFAAKLDDAANIVPARTAAYLMVLASFLADYDAKNAWKIYQRDKYKHLSPNSAHTEAVCAGALNIQLAGENYYFGQLVKKPTIGDDNRQIEAEDIKRTNRLLYLTSFLGLMLASGIRLAILQLF